MRNQWDAISIGAGLGSLTAAALLAKGGARVLVLERHDKPGGAATNFARKGITVEVGLHELDGMDSGDAKVKLLESLGVLQQLTLIPVPELYAVRFRVLGAEFVLPHGFEAARLELTRKFPEFSNRISSFLQEVAALRKAVQVFGAADKNFWWWLVNGPLFFKRFRPLMQHDRTTVSEVMQEYFGDNEAIKLALAANLGYYTDNPSDMGFLYFAVAQGSYLAGGGHYIQGGSQKLAEALVNVIKDNGGEVRLKRQVTGLQMQGGRVTSVTHAAANRIGSQSDKPLQDVVVEATGLVLAGSAPEVTKDLLPPEAQTAFYQPFAGCQPSTSLWSIYLGLNRPASDFGATAYSTFVFPPWVTKLSDLSRDLLASHPQGELPGYVLVDYSRIESGLAEPGKHFATLCGNDHLTNWEGLSEDQYLEKKNAWMDALLAGLDQEFPGIKSSIFYAEMATARTMKDYLNTPGGAVYGYRQHPSSQGRHRKGPGTSIPNLLLSSAFSQPGGGFTGAIFAGAIAARKAKGLLGG